MDELRTRILTSIEERKDELKIASKDFIEDEKENEFVVWSSTLEYMNTMINDIRDLYSMLNKLKRAETYEEFEDEEIKRYEIHSVIQEDSNIYEVTNLDSDEVDKIIDDEIQTLILSAELAYKKFIDERSFE